MTHPIFERFIHPGTMIEAEIELLEQGTDAVAILETFFNGQATNARGVPYRQFGLPMRCALEVACRMGPMAKPLEEFLRSELDKGNFVGAMALGSLGSLDEKSIHSLANALAADLELASESTIALIKCGAESHPAVTEVLAHSEKAASQFRQFEAYMKRSQSEKNPSSKLASGPSKARRGPWWRFWR